MRSRADGPRASGSRSRRSARCCSSQCACTAATATYAHSGIAHLDFWWFAKYPPDLAFLAFSFAIIFTALAVLWRVAREGVPAWLRPFEVYGRVPFIFYVVHFHVLGIAAAIVRTRFDLGTTYLIWLLLLVAMAWPCAWYFEKKRSRPNLVTRCF